MLQIAYPFFPYPIWKLQDERKLSNAKPLNHSESREPGHRTNTRNRTDVTIGNDAVLCFSAVLALCRGKTLVRYLLFETNGIVKTIYVAKGAVLRERKAGFSSQLSLHFRQVT